MRVEKTGRNSLDTLRKRAEVALQNCDTEHSESGPEECTRLFHELRTHQVELELQNEELRTAQMELLASRDRYSELYLHAPVGYLSLNEKGMITESNFTAAQLLGSPRSRLGNTGISTYITPDHVSTFLRCREQSLETGERQACELKLLRKAPAAVWVEARTDCDREVNGDFKQWRVTLSDITEKKRAEELLQAEKELLSVTIRSISDGIILTDTQDRITLMNPVAELLTGRSLEQARGKPSREVFILQDENTHKSYTDSIIKVLSFHEPVAKDTNPVLVASDGTRRIVTARVEPVVSGRDMRMGTVLIFRDITKRRQERRDLYRSRKLESLGVLAGGIAHDLNNAMTTVLGSISLTKNMLSSRQERLIEMLSAAESGVERARGIAHQLLTFATGGEPVKTAVAAEKLVRETSCLASRNSQIRFTLAFAPGLCPIEADRNQIFQVLHHVFQNAIEAMAVDGEIRVSAENACEIPGASPPLKGGSYVKISVKDSGRGIKPEALPRIFDPYYTTKREGRGLGLATSYSIVTRHGGHISIRSRPETGTTVDIFLPSSPLANVEEVLLGPGRAASGTGRVLVMDDEGMVKTIVSQMLAHLGYEVELAGDGKEAVEMYRNALEKGNAV